VTRPTGQLRWKMIQFQPFCHLLTNNNIKIHGNLSKFWQKQKCSFLRHGVVSPILNVFAKFRQGALNTGGIYKFCNFLWMAFGCHQGRHRCFSPWKTPPPPIKFMRADAATAGAATERTPTPVYRIFFPMKNHPWWKKTIWRDTCASGSRRCHRLSHPLWVIGRKSRNFYTSPVFIALAGGDPVGISQICLTLVKLEWLGYRMLKKTMTIC